MGGVNRESSEGPETESEKHKKQISCCWNKRERERKRETLPRGLFPMSAAVVTANQS